MKYALVILFLIPFYTHASKEECESFAPKITANLQGERFGLVIPGSKVEEAGDWSPKKNLQPPLKINKAYKDAKKWLASNQSDFDGFDINSIQFTRYECLTRFSEDEYWYYIVEYIPLRNETKAYESKGFIAVLMSGEVLGMEKL